MSLRARLIIAFLILSIVPLSAVTLAWYISSVKTFERVAQREATDMAADIGRRMEMIKSSMGRRMDRMFDEAIGFKADAKNAKVEERIAPMLGDSAALVERLEFHPNAVPNPDAHPNPNPNPNPDPKAGPGGDPGRFRRGRPPRTPGAPPHFGGPPPPWGPGGPPPAPPPPTPPKVIVVDMPKVIEEAQ